MFPEFILNTSGSRFILLAKKIWEGNAGRPFLISIHSQLIYLRRGDLKSDFLPFGASFFSRRLFIFLYPSLNRYLWILGINYHVVHQLGLKRFFVHGNLLSLRERDSARRPSKPQVSSELWKRIYTGLIKSFLTPSCSLQLPGSLIFFLLLLVSTKLKTVLKNSNYNGFYDQSKIPKIWLESSFFFPHF